MDDRPEAANWRGPEQAERPEHTERPESRVESGDQYRHFDRSDSGRFQPRSVETAADNQLHLSPYEHFGVGAESSFLSPAEREEKLALFPAISEQLPVSQQLELRNNPEQAEKVREFSQVLETRLEKADPIVRRYLEQNIRRLTVSDAAHPGVAYYDLDNPGVYFNLEEDLKNIRGPGATYFHEMGHYLDHMVSGGVEHMFASDAIDGFFDALNADCDGVINQRMAAAGCQREEACRQISEEIWGAEYSSVSDLYDAITGGQCQGAWSHPRSYWFKPGQVEQEAFAHFFEASIGGGHRQELVKSYFPTAYQLFLAKVEELS